MGGVQGARTSYSVRGVGGRASVWAGVEVGSVQVGTPSGSTSSDCCVVASPGVPPGTPDSEGPRDRAPTASATAATAARMRPTCRRLAGPSMSRHAGPGHRSSGSHKSPTASTGRSRDASERRRREPSVPAGPGWTPVARSRADNSLGAEALMARSLSPRNFRHTASGIRGAPFPPLPAPYRPGSSSTMRFFSLGFLSGFNSAECADRWRGSGVCAPPRTGWRETCRRSARRARSR
jgi:hypothetical protein